MDFYAAVNSIQPIRKDYEASALRGGMVCKSLNRQQLHDKYEMKQKKNGQL